MNSNRVVLAALMVAMLPGLASAQQPTRRRQAPIVIRGQVPTPQVVTVRPRAVPAYSRQVLVPRFFDHDFWPEIQLGYQMIPERQVSGRAVTDSLTRSPDSVTTPRVQPPADSSAAARATPPPGGQSTIPPAPARSPSAPADSTRRTGTAPAR